jgi:Flp pilus assembly pilin Flp
MSRHPPEDVCAHRGRNGGGDTETEASLTMTIKQTLDYYLAKLQVGEEGATATEYIVLLVFIALAIIAGAILLGTAINGAFGKASTTITF